MNGLLHALFSGRSRTLLRPVSLGVILSLACTLGLPQTGSADTVGDKKKVDAGITQLRTALEDTSRDLAQAYVQLQRTKAVLPGAQRTLAAADAVQLAADRRREAVVTALVIARENEAKVGNAIAKNSRESQQVSDQLGNLARNDYQRGTVSGLSIALDASSPEDFTNRLMMMDTLMRVRDSTLRGLDTTLAEGRAVRARLVAVRQQVAVLKVQAEAALAQARSARQTAAAAKIRLDLLYAGQARYASTVSAKKDNEATRINTMQARSDALARVLAARAKAARERAAREQAAREQAARARAAQSSAARGSQRQAAPQSLPPGRGSGLLRFPVNAPVSSEFGMRYHPILHFWRLHGGIDFAGPCGAPVYAAAAGDVIMVTPESMSGGYGNQVVIDHGLFAGAVDLTTSYNHLASFAVSGGHVAAGQLVGYEGTTGESTGCHLHFETREDGVPVNPRRWL